MREQENYYSSPDASLDAESPGVDSERAEVDDPTTFVDTIVQMFNLYPQVFLGLIGYYLAFLFVLAFGVGVMAAFGFALAELQPFLMGLAILVGGVLYFLTIAYFWTVAFTYLDKVYHGLPTNSVWSESTDKFGSVAGSMLLQTLVLTPFAGFALVVFTLSEASVGAMCFGALCMLAGYATYLLFHFADLAVITEDTSIVDSMNRSLQLVGGVRNWFYTVALFIAAWLIGVAAMMPVMLVVVGAELAVGEANPILGAVLTGGIQFAMGLLLYPFYAVANYVVFRSLVARNRSQQGF